MFLIVGAKFDCEVFKGVMGYMSFGSVGFLCCLLFAAFHDQGWGRGMCVFWVRQRMGLVGVLCGCG